LIENLKHSINLYSELQLSAEDKKLILIKLGKLALIRGESINDYNFELWLEYFCDKGLMLSEIIEMISAAQDLKKYGDVKLSVGDLIDNYEKLKETKKEVPINWTQFLKILEIYERKALEQINKLAGGNHISVSDYFKHKEYLENQFDKLYKQ